MNTNNKDTQNQSRNESSKNESSQNSSYGKEQGQNRQGSEKQGSEKQNTKGGSDQIDTDKDGITRTKGDTSDHGDPRSPYGNKNGQDNKKQSTTNSK